MTPIPISVAKERGANVVILIDDTLETMLVERCCETTKRASKFPAICQPDAE